MRPALFAQFLLLAGLAISPAQSAHDSECKTFTVESHDIVFTEKALLKSLAGVPEFSDLQLHLVPVTEDRPDLRIVIQNQPGIQTIFRDFVQVTRTRDLEDRVIVGGQSATREENAQRVAKAVLELCVPDRYAPVAQKRRPKEALVIGAPPRSFDSGFPLSSLTSLGVRSMTSALDDLDLRKLLVRRLKNHKIEIRMDERVQAEARISRDLNSDLWQIEIRDPQGQVLAQRFITVLVFDEATDRIAGELANMLAPRIRTSERPIEPISVEAKVRFGPKLRDGTKVRLVADRVGLHLQFVENSPEVVIPLSAVLDVARSHRGGQFVSSWTPNTDVDIQDPFSGMAWLGYATIGTIGSATHNLFDRSDYLHIAWLDSGVEREAMFELSGQNAKRVRDYLRDRIATRQ